MNPLSRPLKVLLLDQASACAEALCQSLRAHAPELEVHHARTLGEVAARAGVVELALLVLSRETGGLRSFAQLYATAPDLPIIIITSTEEEALGLKAVRDGAYDAILTEQLTPTLLMRSLRYALERKTTRDALAQSEERFRQFFERSRDGLFVTTREGVIVEANAAAGAIFGYERGEMIGRQVQQVYADTADREQMLRHVAAHGHADNFEFQAVRKDGSRIDVVVALAPWKNADGEVLGFEGTVRDVSAWRRAERALTESQRAITSLLNNLPGLTYRCNHDPAWSLQFISDGCLELTGYSKEELFRTGFAPLITDADRDRVWADTSAAVADGKQYQLKYRIITASGTEKTVWEQGQPVYDASGALVGLEGLLLDITSQAVAERALRDSEERFRQLAENIREVLWLSTPDKDEIYVSPAFETVWGRPVAQASEFLDAIHPDDRERVLAAMSRQSEGTYDEEYRIIWPDGTERWVRDRAFPITGTDGSVYRLAGIAEDITQQKQAETALLLAQQHSQRTAERMAAVAAAASGVIGARTLEELDAVLRASCQRVLPYDVFTFGEYLTADNALRFVASHDTQDYSPGDTVPLPGTPSERVVRDRKSLLTHSAQDPAAGGARLFGSGRRSESVIRAPITIGARVLGVLSVQSYTPGFYGENDVAVLEAFASIAAGAMQNIELLAELRSSEERFRLVSLAANDAVWEYDWVENKLSASDRYFDSFGLGRDQPDPLGDWMARIHPRDRERVRAGIMNAAHDPAWHVWYDEYELARADGSYMHVADRCYFVRAGDGSPVRSVGAIVDVSEQRRAQLDLRASDERFRQIADNIREVFWAADIDFTAYSYISPACEQVFGVPPEVIREDAAWFMAHVHESDRPNVVASMRALRTGKPQESEYRIVRPEGDIRWVWSRGFPVRDEHGRVYRVVGTTEDITERRMAEQEVRTTTKQLRAVLELSALPIVVVDGEFMVQLWNKSAERVFGWSADEVIGRNYPMMFDEHGSDEDVRRRLHAALTGDSLDGREVRRRIRDGSMIDVRAWATLLPEQETGKSAVVLIFEPVTEQKRLEAQLRHAQKMEAVGQLAGGIAHDFNNILTAINGQAELIIEQMPRGHPIRDDVQEILHAGQRAADLTRQLLAFSRKQIIQTGPVDVNELVQGMVKLLQRMIGPDIALTTTPSPEAAWVEADRGQIEQVIMNLVVNARDAMPEGGELSIAIHHIVSQTSDARVRIVVRDTGTGIARETRARIFEPFFTTKAAGQGTGLGLATVYGIITQSGGEVSVETEWGKGSAFTVELPAIPVPADLDASKRLPQRAPRGSETVLLVDDEPSVRAVARRSLQRHGYVILEAANGAEAMELAAQHPGSIEVLLTDMVMPKMGGREVADRLLETRPDTTVIFMSGYTEDEALRRGVLADGETFIEKPFSPATLVTKMREAIDVRCKKLRTTAHH